MASERTSNPPEIALRGELAPAPRAPWVTVLLALSGILVLVRAAELLARLVLALRQPAEVRLTEAGIAVHARTEMLGQVLRDRDHLLPRGGLVRATRDIRFPRLAMYAGLVALALGSYVGVGFVVDGVRAASASLFGAGALIVLVGLGLDFALASLVPGATGRCRVVLVPKRGRILCVGDVPRADADAFLAALARQVEPAREEAPSKPARPDASLKASAKDAPARAPAHDHAAPAAPLNDAPPRPSAHDHAAPAAPLNDAPPRPSAHDHLAPVSDAAPRDRTPKDPPRAPLRTMTGIGEPSGADAGANKAEDDGAGHA